ncbi:MAG: AAA family ATPase, partial [Verrucomicrobia bacterium]|nr:AAA family ATPase [Verrucomicrobiota bacterium]
MYLKKLEIIGFKSFADKTTLAFEPGMTCIIGPNGCGKSNVADALRWVLGEQSAKALRGSKMEDCIFNGTDGRKPLGMAEVAVTFAGCEETLETEYDEVAVTRRVFRSGEGQYLINKTPCRLKDIQRLFMDTGIGTNSYSMMEQGRIDAILSARPEDRRTIFEEASGITKFKADKKEAIRKLEHTEANLLRLSDVIREVKRQIGSLQRQAGKAKRYQTLQGELRQYDIYATRNRLERAAREIASIETRLAALATQHTEMQQSVREMEANSSALREGLVTTEREIGVVMETGGQARSKLEHTREVIVLHGQRIQEYRTLSERDSLEIDHTRKQVDEQQAFLASHEARLKEAQTQQAEASNAMEAAKAELSAHLGQVGGMRDDIQGMREEAVGLESLASRLQNQLVELETHERTAIIQREKFSAEVSQLDRVLESFIGRDEQTRKDLTTLQNQLEKSQARLNKLEDDRAAAQDAIEAARAALSEVDARRAAIRARIDLLNEAEAASSTATGPSQLSQVTQAAGIPADSILGALVNHLEIGPEYRLALEAALRAWHDAIVIKDEQVGLRLLAEMKSHKAGAVRLLPVDGTPLPSPPTKSGNRLANLVIADNVFKPLVERLIGHVILVESLDDLPAERPATVSYVTREGFIAHGSGAIEYWTADAETTSPFSRKRLLD